MTDFDKAIKHLEELAWRWPQVMDVVVALRKAWEKENEITIDEWNGLTDKAKVLLIRNSPNWTTLQLIEEVEAILKANNA